MRDRTWGPTLLLLTALVLLLQLLAVFLLGAQGAGRFLESRAALRIEVLSTASEPDIQDLYAALRAQPFIRDIRFVTRGQAYETQRKSNPELVAFLEEYKMENPFPDTFSVTLASLAGYGAFQEFLRAPRWKSVVNAGNFSTLTEQERQTRTLLQAAGVVRTLTALFLCLAFVLLCFAVFEWVVRSMMRRRQELLLEHLLGAPPLALLLPLAVEMAVLLLCAVAFSAAGITVFLLLLPRILPALTLEAPFAELREAVVPLLRSALPLLFLLELFVMPLLALGGTVLGSRTALRLPVPLP